MRVEDRPLPAQLSEAMAAGPVRASPLRHPDHRVDARDRGAEPRACAGLLQALLHARERHPGGGGRRDPGRGPPSRRDHLRPRDAPGRPARACPCPGAGAEGAPPRRGGRPKGRAADPAAALPDPLLHHRPGRRLPRSRAASRGSGRRSTSYLYRKLVMETGLAVNAGAGTWARRSTTPASPSTRAGRGVPLEKLEEAVDKVLRRAPAEALDAEAIERPRPASWPRRSIPPTASRRWRGSTARLWRSARPSRRSAAGRPTSRR